MKIRISPLRALFCLSLLLIGFNFRPTVKAQEAMRLVRDNYNPISSQIADPVSDLTGFDLVSANEGWVLLNQRLYWTKTAGQSWVDITPPNLDQSTIWAVSFLNTQDGWLIFSRFSEAEGVTYTLARTSNGGNNWEIRPLSLFIPGDIRAMAEAVYVHVIDSHTGWLVIKQATGSNFSVGSLFKTTDGGYTWKQLTLPIGEPVYFVTSEVGWAAGGPVGDKLYHTVDGGLTWYPQTITRPLAHNRQQQLYQLPTFENAHRGVLPIVVADGAKTQVDFYVSNDTGQSWRLATSAPIGQEMAPRIAIFDTTRMMLITPNSSRLLSLSNGVRTTKPIGQDALITGVSELDMVTPDVGWAKSTVGNCQLTWQPESCEMETRLLQTNDGGQTWTPLEFPQSVSSETHHNSTDSTLLEAPASKLADGDISIQALGSQTQNIVGQGFDKCEIASFEQLQNWFTNSPYKAVNLYIGGSARACSNSALTAAFLSQLSELGWKFIPTWVGPQAACTDYASRMSYDLTTAYNEGVSEANAALEVAASLGLTLANKSGTIIYYDLENYNTGDADCRNAAKSFISGWSSQLQAQGNQAGVYGSACASAISDFATGSYIPDAIWPANWLLPAQYRGDATVWGVACLSDGYWNNHQRIRQYAGGHIETWGNVTLNIDSNVIDGPVAYISTDHTPPTTSITLTGTAGEGNWYRSNVQVTLASVDNSGGSGVALIQYRVDLGAWQNYGGPFTISTEGQHTVGYRAQDNAGNWESEKQTPVNIDKTAPTGSLAINNNASVSYASLVYLNPSASDGLSGVSQVHFRDAGGSWSSWQPVTSAALWQLPVATGQTATVEVQFQDWAGNASGVYSDNILLNIYPARPASAGYRLTRSTFGVSGGLASSANYRLGGTWGQPSAVSGMSGGSYHSTWGYWRATAAVTDKHVYLPMIIRQE